MNNAKLQQKTQKKLGDLCLKNGKGYCWVCGSTSGVKAGREGYAVRCKKCINENKTTADTIEYERLKQTLM